MAAFIRLWDKRGCVLDEIVAFSQDAEKFRESEFNAALKIQSWYRGCRLRAYIGQTFRRRLHKCALVIQRNYRGRLGRNRYRRRLKECLEERRQRYYDTMATKIQRTWRGFYVRKFVFDYYKYHQQMAQVVLTNEAVRAEATSFWQLTEDTRLSQEEHHLEAQALGEARRLHFMLSTQSKNGVFRPFGKSLPIEAQMKSLRLSQEKKPSAGKVKRRSLSSLEDRQSGPSPSARQPGEVRTSHSPSKADGSNSIGLPPLLTPRPQGPFLSSEKVWKYRTRSLNPTLRVATAFNSVEEARAEMKAKEWRERIVEERFKPFSKRPVTYEPMLHTKSSFENRFEHLCPPRHISIQKHIKFFVLSNHLIFHTTDQLGGVVFVLSLALSYRGTEELPSKSSMQPLRQHVTPSTAAQSRWLQQFKNLVVQKSFRAKRMLLFRKVCIWLVMALALVLSWAVGYFKFSWLILVILVVVMALVWHDQSVRLFQLVEQEVEVRALRKKRHNEAESAEWLNVVFNRWWVSSNETIMQSLKDYVEPVLRTMAPPGVSHLELVQLDFANQTPFIKNIQICDPPTPPDSHSPLESSSRSSCLVINMDLGLVSPDSKIVLKARLGGQVIGLDALVKVEGLHLSGPMQAVVGLDFNAPFPHVSSIAATFLSKPDVWFTVKVLKELRVTEIPFLKNWVHGFVMDMITTLMVDPGKLTLDLFGSAPLGIGNSNSQMSRGVLTITLRGSPPEVKSAYASDTRRWCSVRIGLQKYHYQVPVGKEVWSVTYPFLVHSLQDEMMILKIKQRRVMWNVPLAVHSLSLESLSSSPSSPPSSDQGVQLEKTIHLHNTEANIAVDMQYTPLQAVSLHSSNTINVGSQVAGVLYIHVHSASNLPSQDLDGLSDPYCVILANKAKIFTTHFVLDNCSPCWEMGKEIFVSDFTQINLAFIVCDWDGPLAERDFIAMARLNLQADTPEILHKTLDLEVDGCITKDGHPFGQITVSVVFRPVSSVARANIASTTPTLGTPVGTIGTPSAARKSEKTLQIKKTAKHMIGKRMHGKGKATLELSILQGRELAPRNASNLGNTYVIIKYGSDVKFRTKAAKATHNPEWNETVSLSCPSSAESIRVECWSKDRVSDDLMGSAVFDMDSVVQFEEGPKWCKLDNTSSGEILIMIKKIEFSNVADESLAMEAKMDTLSVASSVGAETGSPDSDSSSHNTPQIIITSTPSVPTRESSLSRGTTEDPPVGAEAVDPQSSLTSSSISSTDNHRKVLRRRHSMAATVRDIIDEAQSTELQDDDGSHKDIKKGAELASSLSRTSSVTKRLQQQPSLYYYVSGQVIEVEGLKGDLDHLELYIKVRLNVHPMYQRQQKFSRGPVIHKTRTLRGSSRLQWKEDFMVKDNPIPSDSLMTIDLKSGSKVNIGTHAITLDKFFDGQLKAQRWLEIGNDMKLSLRLTRQT